jgi:uncharacterized protein YdgA (DUF945 family)
MKKIIVAVLLLLVIVGVGAPFVSGLMMERVVKEQVDKTNAEYAELGMDSNIEITKYDRGFSTSDIEMKVNLGSFEAVYGIKEIVITSHSKHGLTGIVTESDFNKNLWYADFVANKLDGKDPLSISSKYTYAGGVVSNVTMDAFSLKLEEGLLNVEKGTLVSNCDKSFSDFTIDANFGGVALGEDMKMSGMSIDGNMKKLNKLLWGGKIGYSIDKIAVNAEGEKAEIDNLKVQYEVDIDESANTMSIVTDLDLDKFVAGQDSLENGSIRIGLSKLDVTGVEEFISSYISLMKNVMSQISESNEDPEKMQALIQEKLAKEQMQLMGAYEKLLKKGLELDVSDIQAKLPEGEIKGNFKLGLNKDMTFAQLSPVMTQPAMLTEIFSLNSNLSLPAALVADNPMLLGPIHPGMQTGFFVQDGENVAHKAEIKDGKLFLNDTEVQL